jgi:hypothetical protein
VEETNTYAQQQIVESVTPFILCSRIRKCQNVTVAEMYLVLLVFMLISISQNPTQRSVIVLQEPLLTACFSETLPLEGMEIKCCNHTY